MALNITQTLFEQAVEMALDKASRYTDNAIVLSGTTPQDVTFDSSINGQLSAASGNGIAVGRAGTARVRFAGSCNASAGVPLVVEFTVDGTENGKEIERQISTVPNNGSFCLEADFAVTSGEIIGVSIRATGASTSTITFSNAQLSLEWQA
jgi:hypothetical protein